MTDDDNQPPGGAVGDDYLSHLGSGFVFGAATSSFQIEGGRRADGKSESIWDRFCSLPGKIRDGSDGTVACDHYGRYGEDVALMRELGLGGYRFSIAWPRVIPTGTGPINERGLDFYDRLVDELLAAGIEPFPTLYHWDLPQVIEDRGGWPDRSIVDAFADYCHQVAHRLGDRVRQWSTINEPFIVANLGYLTGEHAPGRSSLSAALAASHHLLVAHGKGHDAIKAAATTDASVGIVLNFVPMERADDSPLALVRHHVADDYQNAWFTDPLVGRPYPETTRRQLGWRGEEIREGDMEQIAGRTDFLGINFYTESIVGALEGIQRPENPKSALGWDIRPRALGELLRRLDAEYSFPSLVIAENGAAMHDRDREDGVIADRDRIEYIENHLREVAGARAAGVPVDGYYVWSLLDNFEWALGYEPKFGIVEIDEETLDRRPKASARWYADTIQSARSAASEAPMNGT